MSALIGLLFGRRNLQSNVGGVFLDATLAETHEYSSRVTEFPVENGTVISDYVINDPVKISITGIVSDSPIRFLSLFNRSSDAFNRLVRIHEQKEIITVVTGIKIYQNMVMTALSVPRDVDTGQSLSFAMDFQQIILDSTVRFTTNKNQPFNTIDNVIPRDQVADSSKYPYIQGDPPLSLKDQASSGIDIGIQSLQPVTPIIRDNINSFSPLIRGFL